jgi:hypothetical protein
VVAVEGGLTFFSGNKTIFAAASGFWYYMSAVKFNSKRKRKESEFVMPNLNP